MFAIQKNLLNLLLALSVLALTYVTYALIVTGRNAAPNAGDVVSDQHITASDEQRKLAYQKPGAPVRLVSNPKFTVGVGERVDLDLALTTLPQGVTKVEVTGDDGLFLEGDLAIASEGESQLKLPLAVTPYKEQLAYLHLYVEHSLDGKTITTRNLMVSIDSLAPAAALQKLSGPKAVKPYIEMQATETIY